MNIFRFAGLAAVALAACHPAAEDSGPPPLAGARIGAPFALTDQDGHAVTDRSFAGKYRIMYFGYSYCPDVCPTDVAALGAGLSLFEKADPARGAKVVPIFVSVDPARDTPVALKPFVAAYHPRMVGLTGSPAAIAALAKGYGVFFAKGPVRPNGSYDMDHSRQAYLMAPDGKPIALLPQDKGPQAVADELERWVK